MQPPDDHYPQPPPQGYQQPDYQHPPGVNDRLHPSEEEEPTLSQHQQQGFTTVCDFSDARVRARFVQRVYLLLTILLCISFTVVTVFVFVPPVKEYVRAPGNSWLFYCGFGPFLVVYLLLVCVRPIRHKFPVNAVFLLLLALSMGLMCGVVSAYVDTLSFLIAFGITALVTVSVTLFACQTRFDFTRWVGVLFVASIVLLLFGILTIFFHSRILTLVYAAVGALLFTVYLAVDTQLVCGGKRHAIGPDEHVLGAIILYTDIMYIFMMVLSLTGAARG